MTIRISGGDRLKVRMDNLQARHLVQAIKLCAEGVGCTSDRDIADMIIASLRHEWQAHNGLPKEIGEND